jgi:uncharacterized protein DUF6843
MKHTLILLLFILIGCKKGAENEIYYLPSSFTGRIVIFYNQSNGEPKKYENSCRIIEIPENGIFKTQFEANFGIIKDRKFYYKSKDGQLVQILNRHNEPLDSNSIQIFSMSNGTDYPIIESKEIINGTEHTVTKSAETGIVFTEFIVDKYTERSKYNFKTGFEEQAYWYEVKKKAGITK